MRKFFATLLALIFVVSSSFAQHYAEDFVIDGKGQSYHSPSSVNMIYGVMAGLVVPVMRVDHSGADISGRTGFQAGMMWGVDFGMLDFVTEFWYETNNVTFANSSSLAGTELSSTSVEVPLLLGVNIIDELRINMGPSFVLYNDTTATSASGVEYEAGRIKSTSGYVFGASYIFRDNILLDVRYVGRFSSTTNPINNGGSMVDINIYSFNFSLGYKF